MNLPEINLILLRALNQFQNVELESFHSRVEDILTEEDDDDEYEYEEIENEEEDKKCENKKTEQLDVFDASNDRMTESSDEEFVEFFDKLISEDK